MAIKKVKKGDKVKVEYTGTLDDGTVFDSSEKHGAPLEFEIGAGQVIPGFENALVGMKQGEEKEINLEPAQAYGDPNPQLVKQIPKAQIPAQQELKPGMLLLMRLPDGRQVPVKIVEVSEDAISLDLNHPLAGKTLTFKLKVVEISS